MVRECQVVTEVVKSGFPKASSIPAEVYSKAQSCSVKQEQEFNTG